MRLDLGTTSLALFVLGGFSPRTFAAQDPEPQEGPTPIELPGMLDEAQQEMLHRNSPPRRIVTKRAVTPIQTA